MLSNLQMTWVTIGLLRTVRCDWSALAEVCTLYECFLVSGMIMMVSMMTVTIDMVIAGWSCTTVSATTEKAARTIYVDGLTYNPKNAITYHCWRLGNMAGRYLTRKNCSTGRPTVVHRASRSRSSLAMEYRDCTMTTPKFLRRSPKRTDRPLSASAIWNLTL